MKLLKQFQPLLQKKRYKGAKGGRASGKSHFFADCIVKVATKYPVNVVCIREVQKSLKFSAKKLIEDKIRENGLAEKFEITLTEIKTPSGGVIIFQGMQDHTADSIKSLEGFDIAWVEEAQSISERSLELLTPTIRAEKSEIWFSWNPTFEDDAIEVFFKGLTDDDCILVASNYDTNLLAPDTVIDEANRHKKARPDTFNHVWLGEYATAGQVFKASDFKVITTEQFQDMTTFDVDEDWELEDGEGETDLINYMVLDPAVTDSKNSDNSAFTIGCIDPNNNKYVQKTYAKKLLTNDLLEQTLKYARDYNCMEIGVEDSSISKTFIEVLEDAIYIRNLPYSITRLKPAGRNKEARIQQYVLSAMNQNRLYFIDEVDKDLISEAVNFPDAVHDDRIDSVALFIEMGNNLLARSGTKVNHIQPQNSNRILQGNQNHVY